MKKLLLTSAIVAVAGGAAAEISWSGDAEVGYKSHFEYDVTADPKADPTDPKYDAAYAAQAMAVPGGIYLENVGDVTPLYYEAGLTATGSADLGGGITATLAYDLDFADANRISGANTGPAFTLNEGFPTLTIEAPVAKVIVGETDHVAHEWVDTIGAAEFSEDDDELNFRIQGTYSGINVGMSYVIGENKAGGGGMMPGSYQLAAAGEFSGVVFGLGYQVDDNSSLVNTKDDTTFGINAGYTWQGITGKIIYASKDYGDQGAASGYNETSIGFTADYTMSNGVKLGAEYSMNSSDSDAGDRAGLTVDGFGMDKNSNGYDTYNAYDIWAGFEALGADITVGYKNENDVLSQFDSRMSEYYVAGLYIDAAYEIEGTGVKLVGGYDQTESIVAFGTPSDYDRAVSRADAAEFYGGYYVGAYYGLGDNASVFATYSNADEMDPDEDIAPGATLGMKVSF